jgi:hypothetical protein
MRQPISRLQRILAFAPRVALKEAFPDVDWSPASGVTAETAERLWAHIRRSDWQPEMLRLLNLAFTPNHSAGVLAVDEQGNVASILHTCNCYGWGSTDRECRRWCPLARPLEPGNRVEGRQANARIRSSRLWIA